MVGALIPRNTRLIWLLIKDHCNCLKPTPVKLNQIQLPWHTANETRLLQCEKKCMIDQRREGKKNSPTTTLYFFRETWESGPINAGPPFLWNSWAIHGIVKYVQKEPSKKPTWPVRTSPTLHSAPRLSSVLEPSPPTQVTQFPRQSGWRTTKLRVCSINSWTLQPLQTTTQ